MLCHIYMLLWAGLIWGFLVCAFFVCVFIFLSTKMPPLVLKIFICKNNAFRECNIPRASHSEIQGHDLDLDLILKGAEYMPWSP